MEPYHFPPGSLIGDIFEEAKVMRIEKDYGMVLQLPTEPEQRAFVHVRNIFPVNYYYYYESH